MQLQTPQAGSKSDKSASLGCLTNVDKFDNWEHSLQKLSEALPRPFSAACCREVPVCSAGSSSLAWPSSIPHSDPPHHLQGHISPQNPKRQYLS